MCLGSRLDPKTDLPSDAEECIIVGPGTTDPVRPSSPDDNGTENHLRLEVHCKRDSRQSLSSVLRVAHLSGCTVNRPVLASIERTSDNWYRTWCLQPVSCTIERLHMAGYRSISESSATLPLDTHYAGQVQRLLMSVTSWDFNVFSLDVMTRGRPLFFLSLHLFQQHGFIERFKLDVVKLMHLFSQIESGYHGSNPYHNAVHAADVTQAMNCFILESKLSKSLTALETLSSLLAAISHDLDHPGINQSFLIATSNPLVPLYQSKSVLENHHWRNLFCLLRLTHVFDHFDNDSWKILEWQTSTQILATDISCQQEILGKFQQKLNDGSLNVDAVASHRNLALQIALKCADICNPCRSWELTERWTYMVCTEFFQQGDFERGLRLPVSKMCDRQATTVAQVQRGFISYIVRPLFVEWQRFVDSPLGQLMLDCLDDNQRRWRELEAAETAAATTTTTTTTAATTTQPSAVANAEPSHSKPNTSSPDRDCVESVDAKSSANYTGTGCVQPQPAGCLKRNTGKNNTSANVGCESNCSLPQDDILDAETCAELSGRCTARRSSLPPPCATGADLCTQRRNSAPVIIIGRSTTATFKRLLLTALVEHSSSCSTPNSFVSDKSGGSNFFRTSVVNRRRSEAAAYPMLGLGKPVRPFSCDRLPFCTTAALVCTAAGGGSGSSKKVPSWNSVSPMESGVTTCMFIKGGCGGGGAARSTRSNSQVPGGIISRSCFVGHAGVGRRFSSPAVVTDPEMTPLLMAGAADSAAGHRCLGSEC